MAEVSIDKQEELEALLHSELIQRILDLELLLEEFQESSKELELGLEVELEALESNNAKLQTALADSRNEVKICNSRLNDLTRELNDLYEVQAQEVRQHNQQMTSLRQQVVSVEITNDSMESNDRILSNKLELSKQFNNELLERMALIESDLEREKRANLSNQLYITNYQNQVQELTEKLQIAESGDISLDEDTYTPNTTILGISDALADCHFPEIKPENSKPHQLVASYSKIQLKLPSQYDVKSSTQLKLPSQAPPQGLEPAVEPAAHPGQEPPQASYCPTKSKYRIPHSHSTRKLHEETQLDDSHGYNQKRNTMI